MERLDRHDLEKLGNSLKLTLVEAALVEFFYIGRNRHSFNRLFLVLNDDGSDDCFIHNYSSGQHLPMRRGMIYFMPANADLGFSFTTGVRFISFHFHLELFGYLNIFRHRTDCAVRPDDAGMIDRLAAIIQASGWHPGGLCYLRGSVLQLAGDFLTAAGENCEMATLNALNERYGTLFEYIRRQIDAQTSIDELAEAAGMSRDTLSRKFSRDCGLTLKQYLNQALTRKAEQLLLAPGATARQVAEQLRFNNEYYFSRFFRKNTGVTTLEYRMQMHMDAAL